MYNQDVSNWFKNDKLFLSELNVGRYWQTYVAIKMLLDGLPIQMPKQTIRKNVADRNLWSNETDVFLDKKKIEIKSRNLSFTSVNDFPYNNPFVDTVSGWEIKDPKPYAILIVSQITGNIIVIPANSENYWTTVSSYDKIRKIHDEWYACDKKHMVNYNEFIETLINDEKK